MVARSSRVPARSRVPRQAGTVQPVRVVGRLVAIALFAVVAPVATAPPAAACSCAGPPPELAAAVARADGAFVGTLVEIRDPDGGDAVISGGRVVQNHFDVEGVAKGDIGSSVVVLAAANGAACGIEVAVGQRAALLLTREADQWRSSLCSKSDPDAMLALSALPRTGGSERPANLGLGFFIGAITLAAVTAISRRSPHDPARRQVTKL